MTKKHSHKKHPLIKRWHRFAFRHTVAALLLISGFVLALDTAIVQTLITEITSLGFIGIVLTGVLFTSFFTAAPAVALLLTFANDYNPLLLSLVAGCGAMLGDYIILKFAEDKIGSELKPVAKKLKLMSFINVLHKKRYKPITATAGALIIASPFPDEAGVALLGLSHLSVVRLMLLTFILNSAGILSLILAFTP